MPPTGKTFAGWNTQADGNGEDVAAGRSTYMRIGGLTLYAKWSN
ncbi:InlB B-repeat-containing protein [Olavius algarvensis spirochete endosymbiont]